MTAGPFTLHVLVTAALLLLQGSKGQEAIFAGFSADDLLLPGALPETFATGQQAQDGFFAFPTDDDIEELPQSMQDLLGPLIETRKSTIATVSGSSLSKFVLTDTEEKIAELAEVVLERFEEEAIGKLVSMCGCSESTDIPPETTNIREISNIYMSGGEVRSRRRYSNFLWAWGQWIDHNLVATLTDPKSETFTILLDHAPPEANILMRLQRLETAESDDPQCKVPVNALTPLLDASSVYSPNEEFLQQTLREPGTCRLRVNMDAPGERDHLPLTTKVSDKGNVFFIAGDLRVNEHGVLSAMHTIWLREHNRLCQIISQQEADKKAVSDECAEKNLKTRACRNLSKERNRLLDVNEQFDLAKMIVTAKIQHITVEEFLPSLGISKSALQNHKPKLDIPDVSVEFATAAYRFGHDMVPDMIGNRKVSEIFSGEKFLLESGGTGRVPKPDSVIDDLMVDLANEKAGQVDGKVGDALRNILFGPLVDQNSPFGEDLVSRNIFRGRDMKMKSYGEIAKCFGQKNTKADRIPLSVKDSFPHLLADNDNPSRKTLGSVTRAILLDQFHRSIFGKGGLYYKDDISALRNFKGEVRRTRLSKVIMDNTGAKVQKNVFRV